MQRFSFPPAPMLVGYLVVATMMGCYMLCLFAALAHTNPTFVAVGSLFVTPVTLVWDIAAGRTASISVLSLLGMALLLGALLVVIYAEGLDKSFVCMSGAVRPRLTNGKAGMELSSARAYGPVE